MLHWIYQNKKKDSKLNEEDLEKQFKAKYQPLVEKISQENIADNSKKDYRLITDPKFKIILSMKRNKINTLGDKLIQNIGLVVAILPEWAKSIFKIEVQPGMFLSISDKDEIKQALANEKQRFEEYYQKHSDKIKPKDMWLAPLKLNFEYIINNVTPEGKRVGGLDKHYSYHDAFREYKRYKHAMKKIDDYSIIPNKYVVKFAYINKQKDAVKKQKHQYWVYPKNYKAIVDKKGYDLLQHTKSFKYVTKLPGSEDEKTKIAIALQIRPAYKIDLKRYKATKIDPIDLNDGQKEAEQNYIFILYLKHQDYCRSKAYLNGCKQGIADTFPKQLEFLLEHDWFNVDDAADFKKDIENKANPKEQQGRALTKFSFEECNKMGYCKAQEIAAIAGLNFINSHYKGVSNSDRKEFLTLSNPNISDSCVDQLTD